MRKFQMSHAWMCGLLAVIVSGGCSGSQGYNTVKNDTSGNKLIATIENAPPPDPPTQSVASRSQTHQTQMARQLDEISVPPTAPLQNVALAAHLESTAHQVGQANLPRQSAATPPISSLHLQQLARRQAARNQKLETPALIFTTVPPKAEGEVAELLQVLRTGETRACREAIYALGRRGLAAAAAAPTLTVMLKDRDHMVRVHAALALWRITERADFSVPMLADSVNFGSPQVRAFSAVALSEIGPAAREAIPSLKVAIEKNPGKVRVQAAEALWYIAGNNEKSLQALVMALHHADSEVRWAASYALGAIAPNNEKVIASLAGRLRDPNDSVRVAAAYALGEIGPPAQPVVSMLATAVGDPNQDVRQAAGIAIRRVDP